MANVRADVQASMENDDGQDGVCQWIQRRRCFGGGTVLQEEEENEEGEEERGRLIDACECCHESGNFLPHTDGSYTLK